MSRFYGKLPDLVIPDAGTVSNIINNVHGMGDGDVLSLYAVNVTDAGKTYTFDVNVDQEATASTSGWCELQLNTAAQAVRVPASGKAISYAFNTILTTVGAIRIKASGAVTGAQTWACNKSFVIES